MAVVAVHKESDVGLLWDAAVKEFEKDTEINLKALPQRSWTITQIAMEQEAQLRAFTNFRHDKSKVDRLRHVMARNVEIVSKAGEIVASATSSIFPPSTAILCACTAVMTASKHVSEDYNTIESFFDVMHSFLQRISLLEDKIPSELAYQEMVINVFRSLLKLCAMAHKYCKKWGRLIKWAKALVEGKDEDLKAAYDKLHDTIKMLESATILQTLRVATETSQNVKDLKSMEKNLERTTNLVEDGLAVSYQTFDVVTDTNTGVREVITISRDNAERGFRVEELLRRMQQSRRESQQIVEVESIDSGSRKIHAVKRIREILHMQADNGLRTRLKTIEVSFVPTTFEWLATDEAYADFLDESTRFLQVFGATGMGKSYLAFSIYHRLRDEFQNDGSSSVACFFFDSDSEDMQSVVGMLRTCALQIIEQDIGYREELKPILIGVPGIHTQIGKVEDCWNILIRDRFVRKSRRRLILILDSIGDAIPDQATEFMSYLKNITTEELNIQVLFTGEAATANLTKDLTLAVMTLSLDKISEDLVKLARARIRSLTRLRKLRGPIKRHIVHTLRRKADSFLYVEHMLRRFNGFGREGSILNGLDTLPQTTTEIYEILVADCQKHRTEDEIELLQSLFTWLAHSTSRLSLAAAKSLLQIVAKDHSYSIEEDLFDGRLSRLLNLTTSPEDDDQGSDSDVSDNEGTTSANRTKSYTTEDEASSWLGFLEPALKSYFRNSPVEKSGGLRLPDLDAQIAMFRMILTILTTGTSPKQTNWSRDKGEQQLVAYCTKQWLGHLCNIDPKEASNPQAAVVLEGLYSIMTNKNAVFKKMERTVANTSTANIFGRTGEDIELGIATLALWAQRGSELPMGTLSDGTNGWVYSLLDTPSRVLILIARAQVENWFANDVWSLGNHNRSLGYAYRSLHAAYLKGLLNQHPTLKDHFDRYSDAPEIGDDSYKAVSDAFWDIPKTAETLWKIALSQAWDQRHALALQTAKQGLKIASTDRDRYYLLKVIGQSLFQLVQEELPKSKGVDDRQMPEEHLANGDGTSVESAQQKMKQKQAMISIELPSKTVELLEESLEYLSSSMDSKAHSLAPTRVIGDRQETETKSSLGQLFAAKAGVEIALGKIDAAVTSTKSLVQLETQGLIYLSDIVRDLALREQWEPIMEVVEFRNSIIFANYFCYSAARDPRLHTIFQRAAKEVDKVNELKTVYLEGIAHLDQFGISFIARGLYPKFAFQVLRDREEAKRSLRETMELKGGHSYLVQSAGRLLTSVLLDDFNLCKDLKQKEDILAEARKVIEIMADSHGQGFDPSLSQAVIPVILMLRKLGPASEFHGRLDESFRGCMVTATDTRQSNDFESFRMLAKVLSVLPGMEWDAQIALTLQFYIVDLEIFRQERGETPKEESQSASKKAADGNKESPHGSPKLQQVPKNGDANETVSHGMQNRTEQTKTPAEGEERESQTTPADNNNNNKEPTQEEIAQEEDRIDYDYDIRPVRCDICERDFREWEVPMYYCLYCDDIDFCGSCFERRRKGQPQWRMVCPPGHSHIHGPVPKWKGVKDGVMYFEDGQTLTVDDWIDGLPAKWTGAWEKYWYDGTVQ